MDLDIDAPRNSQSRVLSSLEISLSLEIHMILSSRIARVLAVTFQ